MTAWPNEEFAMICRAVRHYIDRHGPVTDSGVPSLARRIVNLLTVDQILEISPAAAMYAMNMLMAENEHGIEAMRERITRRAAEFLEAERDGPALASARSRIAELEDQVGRLTNKLAEGAGAEVARLTEQVRGLQRTLSAADVRYRKLDETYRALKGCTEQRIGDAVKAETARMQRHLDKMQSERSYYRSLYISLLRMQDDGCTIPTP